MSEEMALEQTEATAIIESWVTCAIREDRIQRRQDSRYPFFRAATVSRGGMEVPAMCRDISKRGIGILQTDCPPKVGDASVSVWLRNKVVDLEVDIKWVKALKNGWWASGGQLLISSRDYASLFLSRIGADVERRYHRRHPFCHAFSVYPCSADDEFSFNFDPHHQDDMLTSVSLDVSYGGISPTCDESIEPQIQYVYLGKNEDEGERNMIRGRVVSRRELPNGYHSFGIQFATSVIEMKSAL